jgi:hypothetical protein
LRPREAEIVFYGTSLIGLKPYRVMGNQRNLGRRRAAR